MKKINNFYEKRLIVAKKIIITQKNVTPEIIIAEWCSLFPMDKNKVTNDTNLFEWMTRFIHSNNLKSCNELIEKLRRKHAHILHSKCKKIGYNSKLHKIQSDKLASYIIYTQGIKYAGNFNQLCCRIGRLK